MHNVNDLIQMHNEPCNFSFFVSYHITWFTIPVSPKISSLHLFCVLWERVCVCVCEQSQTNMKNPDIKPQISDGSFGVAFFSLLFSLTTCSNHFSYISYFRSCFFLFGVSPLPFATEKTSCEKESPPNNQRNQNVLAEKSNTFIHWTNNGRICTFYHRCDEACCFFFWLFCTLSF